MITLLFKFDKLNILIAKMQPMRYAAFSLNVSWLFAMHLWEAQLIKLEKGATSARRLQRHCDVDRPPSHLPPTCLLPAGRSPASQCSR